MEDCLFFLACSPLLEFIILSAATFLIIFSELLYLKISFHHRKDFIFLEGKFSTRRSFNP